MGVCVSQGAACGHGVTNRNVTCVRASDGETADWSHCSGSGQPKPLAWQNCYVSCGPGCALSEWSPWSHCHGDCQKETVGYETRSRTVVSQSPPGAAASCTDPLWETRDCRIPPCLGYDWALSANADVICRRSDGLVVSECECENRTGYPVACCLPRRPRSVRTLRPNSPVGGSPNTSPSSFENIQNAPFTGSSVQRCRNFSCTDRVSKLLDFYCVIPINDVISIRKTVS